MSSLAFIISEICKLIQTDKVSIAFFEYFWRVFKCVWHLKVLSSLHLDNELEMETNRDTCREWFHWINKITRNCTWHSTLKWRYDEWVCVQKSKRNFLWVYFVNNSKFRKLNNTNRLLKSYFRKLDRTINNNKYYIIN